ncbi:MAG: hypothetical protein VB127_06100 [Sphaerochaeta sp.]|nr:hypothetical protein [Sphaerochaeta sp.]
MIKLALLLIAFLCSSCSPSNPPSEEQLLLWEMLSTYGHILSYAMDDAPDAYSFSSTSSPSYTWTHTFTNLTTPNGSYAHGTDAMGFVGAGLPPCSATFSMSIRTGAIGSTHALYWEMLRVEGLPVFSNFTIDGVSFQAYAYELADFYEGVYWFAP